MWLVLIEKLPQCSSWHAANKSINWNHVSAVRELRAGTRAEKDEPIHRERRTHTPASQFLNPIWQPGPHPGPSPRTGGRGGGFGLTRSNIVPGSSQEEGWGWSWRRLSGGGSRRIHRQIQQPQWLAHPFRPVSTLNPVKMSVKSPQISKYHLILMLVHLINIKY